MSDTELSKTVYKLLLIRGHAQRDKGAVFTSLAHLLNEDYLSRCYFSLNRNKAIGIDNISWKGYGEDLTENIKNLVTKLKRKKFKPQPAKRVYIPKGDGKFRPLGISSIENKIVERGIADILSSIYEEDFIENSFGFRPKRSAHDALKKVNSLIMFQPVSYIVEADIKGFFDNVSHKLLMDFIRIRISDSSLLLLIEKFLKAGYVDDGLLIRSDVGTPQGSILSPILANIFLHYVLDDWFENVVKKNVGGFCELVRYADDFVVLVRYHVDAVRIERALYNRFNKYELTLHPDKSKRFSFGRFELKKSKEANRKAYTFDFLGLTHYCKINHKGMFSVGRKTSKKKFRTKNKDMNNWLRKVRNTSQTYEWWKILNSKLRGHYQYYGVTGNYKSIYMFYLNTKKMVFKWLNRQSQKRRMNWAEFTSYLEHYPLEKPKIKHNFYYTCNLS